LLATITERLESVSSIDSSSSDDGEVPVKSKENANNLTMEQDLDQVAELQTTSPTTKAKGKKSFD